MYHTAHLSDDEDGKESGADAGGDSGRRDDDYEGGDDVDGVSYGGDGNCGDSDDCKCGHGEGQSGDGDDVDGCFILIH